MTEKSILGPDGNPAGPAKDAQEPPVARDRPEDGHPEGGEAPRAEEQPGRPPQTQAELKSILESVLGQLEQIVPGAAVVLVSDSPHPGQPPVISGGIVGRSVLETYGAVEIYLTQAKAGIGLRCFQIPNAPPQQRIAPVGAVPGEIYGGAPNMRRRSRRGQ